MVCVCVSEVMQLEINNRCDRTRSIVRYLLQSNQQVTFFTNFIVFLDVFLTVHHELTIY